GQPTSATDALPVPSGTPEPAPTAAKASVQAAEPEAVINGNVITAAIQEKPVDLGTVTGGMVGGSTPVLLAALVTPAAGLRPGAAETTGSSLAAERSGDRNATVDTSATRDSATGVAADQKAPSEQRAVDRPRQAEATATKAADEGQKAALMRAE